MLYEKIKIGERALEFTITKSTNMKYLLYALIFLVSCSKSEKSNTKCYKCTSGYSGTGEPPRTISICSNQIDTLVMRDSNGNPTGQTCTEQ
jgi:hypothetical protein